NQRPVSGERRPPENRGMACWTCNEIGHRSQDCPSRGRVPQNRFGNGEGVLRNGNERGPPRGNVSPLKTCYACGVQGHISRDCPNQSRGRGGPPRGGYKANQLRNGSVEEEEGSHVYLD